MTEELFRGMVSALGQQYRGLLARAQEATRLEQVLRRLENDHVESIALMKTEIATLSSQLASSLTQAGLPTR
jgi:hypothetical protein